MSDLVQGILVAIIVVVVIIILRNLMGWEGFSEPEIELNNDYYQCYVFLVTFYQNCTEPDMCNILNTLTNEMTGNNYGNFQIFPVVIGDPNSDTSGMSEELLESIHAEKGTPRIFMVSMNDDNIYGEIPIPTHLPEKVNGGPDISGFIKTLQTEYDNLVPQITPQNKLIPKRSDDEGKTA